MTSTHSSEFANIRVEKESVHIDIDRCFAYFNDINLSLPFLCYYVLRYSKFKCILTANYLKWRFVSVVILSWNSNKVTALVNSSFPVFALLSSIILFLQFSS